jgi:hypothetical protein
VRPPGGKERVARGRELTIRGLRRDLTHVREPQSVTLLKLKGVGVRSLEGIEAFTSLEWLVLHRVRRLDLRPLQQMTLAQDA